MFPLPFELHSSPLDVWKDFDPNAGDFNEEIIQEQRTNGVYYRESYISAYHQGQEIRVYCKYAVKEGAKNAPGLMNVHGWMGAPSIDNAYVDDGWAVMSHDYCGDNGSRAHYTKYPEKLRYGNMDRNTGYRIKSKLPDGSDITNPNQTDDYLWYLIQRRALSYLLSQKEVDASRIGAKGYSYGGTVMWNLATDSRVKAVAAYFGVGWLEYYRTRRVWMYDPSQTPPEPSPGEKLYLSTIAPQAHAPYITAACLWLNGTNDHHGGHERGEQIFKGFQPGVPWSFAHQPRGHHDTQDIGQNTKLWLDKHVLGKQVAWPQQAESKIELDSAGVPELHIAPANPDQVTDLKLYYALKNPVSYGRAWRDAENQQRKGKVWIGKLPVMNIDDYVFGFANIKYQNTIVRSSPFTAAIPSKLGAAKATDKPSTNLSEGTGAWLHVGPVQGKDGIKGFRALHRRGTQNEQFSDPKWKAPDGANLYFKFYCTQPQSIVMGVNNQHESVINIPASNDWQSMVLPADRFINKYNKAKMPNWSDTKAISMKPASGSDLSKIVFADFKWSMEPAAAVAAPIKIEKMPAGKRIYLDPKLASTSESFLKVAHNRGWQGGPIKVGGKVFEKGIGVHADSKLVFPLNGEFTIFHVVPGPDDAQGGTIEMKVLVDDKEVYNSGATNSRDGQQRKALRAPVTDAKTLTLIVTNPDGDRGGDHACWADAFLLSR